MTSDANPYVDQFTGAMAQAGFQTHNLEWPKVKNAGADLIVLHWPNEFFRRSSTKMVVKRLGSLLVAKVRGARIVWVAHNVRPHEGEPRSNRIVERLFFTLLSGIIFLSESSRQAIETEYDIPRSVRRFVTVLGMDMPSRSATPRSTGQGGRLLFYGRIRRYKAVEDLIAAFQGLGERELSLTVAGTSQDDYGDEIASLAARDPRIVLDVRRTFLSDEDIEQHVARCAGVVLPFKRILNSSSVLHAVSLGRPVLAPGIGSLPEVQRDIGGDWLHLYEGELTPERLGEFIAATWAPPQGPPDLSAYSWSRVSNDFQRFAEVLGIELSP